MRRFARVVAYLALGGLGLVGVLYVGSGLAGSVRVADAKKQAAADLAAALPAGERRATMERDHVRVIADRWGLPAYSWQELVCELETNDVGWVVREWVQQCDIRSVDLIPVTHAAAGDCEHLYVPEMIEAAGTGIVGVSQGWSTVLAAELPWTRMCPNGLTEPPLPGDSRVLQGRRPSTCLRAPPGWSSS